MYDIFKHVKSYLSLIHVMNFCDFLSSVVIFTNEIVLFIHTV